MERFGKSLRHKEEAICLAATEVNYDKLPKIMVEEITFGNKDYMGIDCQHTDALVIPRR